jgi:hypothetical protein
MPYRLNETTELIDYDQVLELPLVSILAQCVFTVVTLPSSLGMASNGRLRTKKVFCDISLTQLIHTWCNGEGPTNSQHNSYILLG